MERMMRTLAIAASMAALWASPATAQIWGGTNMSAPTTSAQPLLYRDLGKADGDIRDGRNSGQLTRREARDLRRQERMIGVLEQRYASDGLSDPERAELATRLELLRNDTIARRSGRRK
jgi:hypothetical protein